MVDAHYDLLSICYTCYLKNDYTKIKEIANKINNNKNIKYIFANLYFMSMDEMKQELHENYYNSNISILTMFKISKQILEYYLPNVEFIYSIEGCDFVDINDLDELYNEGLRSIVPVLNTENRYGSGNRTGKGLTKEGIDFISKAIDLGIGIDLSHANKNTFYGIIELIKQKQNLGKDVICYASHSNSKTLCNKERNLDDNQIKSIKEVNGLIGIFCNKHFITKENNLTKEELNLIYVKHIIHVAKIIGIDNIMLSTDDMSFMIDIDPEYQDTVMFDYSNIQKEITSLLQSYFSVSTTNKIMFENVYDKIIKKLNNKNKYR